MLSKLLMLKEKDTSWLVIKNEFESLKQLPLIYSYPYLNRQNEQDRVLIWKGENFRLTICKFEEK